MKGNLYTMIKSMKVKLQKFSKVTLSITEIDKSYIRYSGIHTKKQKKLNKKMVLWHF